MPLESAYSVFDQVCQDFVNQHADWILGYDPNDSNVIYVQTPTPVMWCEWFDDHKDDLPFTVSFLTAGNAKESQRDYAFQALPHNCGAVIIPDDVYMLFNSDDFNEFLKSVTCSCVFVVFHSKFEHGEYFIEPETSTMNVDQVEICKKHPSLARFIQNYKSFSERHNQIISDAITLEEILAPDLNWEWNHFGFWHTTINGHQIQFSAGGFNKTRIIIDETDYTTSFISNDYLEKFLVDLNKAITDRQKSRPFTTALFHLLKTFK